MKHLRRTHLDYSGFASHASGEGIELCNACGPKLSSYGSPGERGQDGNLHELHRRGSSSSACAHCAQLPEADAI